MSDLPGGTAIKAGARFPTRKQQLAAARGHRMDRTTFAFRGQPLSLRSHDHSIRERADGALATVFPTFLQ
jgi:hypothetical protein